MLTFISTLLIMAALALTVYIYREQIEAFAPGWKGKVWHGVVTLGGFVWAAVEAVVQYLQTVNVEELGAKVGIDPLTAALAAFVVGVVGLLISYVTRRKDVNGDGVIDERDQEPQAG